MKTNAAPEKQQESTHCKMTHKSNTSSTSIPCFSTDMPPECGQKIVVECNRVDDNGVWGSLAGWGSNCTAYIPVGFVVPQRGRGERRAQADFLTRAKRQCSKGKPISVVAIVESIEVASSNGVGLISRVSGAQICDTFLISATRRGLDKSEEKATLESLKNTQRCAALLVDKAAAQANFGQNWAREFCLYQPYRRALKSASSKSYSTDDSQDPLLAAVQLLLNQIGVLDEANVDAIKGLLIPRDLFANDNSDECFTPLFAEKLWGLCRRERLRQSKPVTFSVTEVLGGATELSNLASSVGGLVLGDAPCLQSAIAAVAAEEPPLGCTKLKVSTKGSGKYSLQTQSPPENQAQATLYLESSLDKIKKLYKSNAQEAFYCGTCKGKAEVLERPSGKTLATLQPTLNIGLIGDVANGKSTLIRAITGKTTQSHSSEHQKHGMTIRLGFANASIVRCQNDGCGMFCFHPDETDPLPEQYLCRYCNSRAELITRVSFIDCPGHQELMATMLSGSSAFDAVIFAAAANVPCPTPQARQHLEALRMSSIAKTSGRVAVVQTKAELLAKKDTDFALGIPAGEKLALHARNAKEKLTNTIANGAPFFPVCAPLGLGLQPLAKWLALLSFQEVAKATSKGDCFAVLRSFDVNYAGSDATKITGGVLGGSIRGAATFRPGDHAEVRPGVFLGKNGDKGQMAAFKVQPLRFEINGIMTEKFQLLEAKSGGLVAFQTTLCPSLCADDRLAGSIIGHFNKLPPVFGPTLLMDQLEFVTTDVSVKKAPEKLLKKGVAIRLHAGPATVTGKIVRISKTLKKVELKLNRPICAFRGSSVAIEATSTESKFDGYVLVAHALIVDGTVCLEGSETDDTSEFDKTGNEAAKIIEIEDDPLDEASIRAHFLEALSQKSIVADGNSSVLLSVPSPSVTRDGGSHVLIDNFSNICKALNRDESHLQAYLVKEGGLSCARAGASGCGLRVRYRSRGFSELLRRIIRRYVAAFVTCQECKSAKTEFLVASGSSKAMELVCRQCNARRFVSN